MNVVGQNANILLSNSIKTSPSVGAIYRILKEKKEAFDPGVFVTPIKDTLIVLFRSYGKASLVECKSLEEMKESYK